MLKPIAYVAFVALWSYSFQQGCQDLKKSVTHLSYYPIRDMRQTVAIGTQRTTWGAPDSLTVPTIGRDPYPDEMVPYDVSSVRMVAPPASEGSVARGDSLFKTICWTCHGKTLIGDGPVTALYIPPPDLLAEGTRGRTDGYLYMYMRHGGAVMPSYGNVLSAHDAWDIVHYIRHMQQVSPR